MRTRHQRRARAAVLVAAFVATAFVSTAAFAGAGTAAAQDTGSVGAGAGSSEPPTVGSLHNDVTAPFLESVAVTTTITQPPGPRAQADCEAVRRTDLDLAALHWAHTECAALPDGAWAFSYRQLPAPFDVALAQVRFHS